ncbi:MAG: hydrogenase 3 maturation endopeptidase HyCI [Candidatus Freyarchaeota archaeon]|nr:hydrogenase 3 maturation endopeptidase HyCI [Candidatus Jordarchaeia archaeon]
MITDKLKEMLRGAVRVAVVGVGSRIRGDDALGLEVARRLSGVNLERVLVVEAETTPENFTGVIRRFNPSHVVVVDAAHFGGSPGDVVVTAEASSLGGVTFSVHHTPLSVFAKFVKSSIGASVVFVGVQPKNMTGEGMSPEVEEAVEAVTNILREVLLELLG